MTGRQKVDKTCVPWIGIAHWATMSYITKTPNNHPSLPVPLTSHPDESLDNYLDRHMVVLGLK